jgi:hypothetical protein
MGLAILLERAATILWLNQRIRLINAGRRSEWANRNVRGVAAAVTNRNLEKGDQAAPTIRYWIRTTIGKWNR